MISWAKYNYTAGESLVILNVNIGIQTSCTAPLNTPQTHFSPNTFPNKRLNNTKSIWTHNSGSITVFQYLFCPVYVVKLPFKCDFSSDINSEETLPV